MAILLSVKPQHLANILNGKKTIEIMKNVLPLNIPVYLYCTKGKPYLVNFGDYEHPYKAGGMGLDFDLKNIERHGAKILNGKVVAKCVFNEIYWLENEWASERHGNGKFFYQDHFDKAYIDRLEAWKYANGKDLYAYQISNPEIFDTPKELSKFGVLDKAETKRYDGLCKVYKPITKAPQSWCYVEEFK